MCTGTTSDSTVYCAGIKRIGGGRAGAPGGGPRRGTWSDSKMSACATGWGPRSCATSRSEEHTSELQSQFQFVCRLLLEKKKHCTPYNPVATEMRDSAIQACATENRLHHKTYPSTATTNRIQRPTRVLANESRTAITAKL